MLLSSPSFLRPQPFSISLKTHPSSFLHGSISLLPKLASPSPSSLQPPSPFSLVIKAIKKIKGRVVRTINDKTVSVEVIRSSVHPKYKIVIRKTKKFQAHDPENQLKIGDFVQLEPCRPISKTKAFIAVPLVGRNVPKYNEPVNASLLDLAFESWAKTFSKDEPQEKGSAE